MDRFGLPSAWVDVHNDMQTSNEARSDYRTRWVEVSTELAERIEVLQGQVLFRCRPEHLKEISPMAK